MFGLGSLLGRGFYRFSTSRRKITLRNLEICFPELNEVERVAMAKKVFRNVGVGSLELMIPWLNPKRSLADRFTVEGKEHLDAAVAKGRGVILLGAHFAVMDVVSEVLCQQGPIDVMYRFNKNPVWEWLQVSGRARYFDGVIEREDMRQILRRLRKGRVIWYAPDQDYGPDHSVFAKFFGVYAASITATSRMARLNDCPVLALRMTRDYDNRRWSIVFQPVLEGFPSGDDQLDAEAINRVVEDMIKVDPTQYLWMHKRFKTRPEGEASLYD